MLTLAFEWPRLPATYALFFVAYTGFGFYRGRVRWERTSWQLGPLGLRIRHGWLVRWDVFVPRARIQHLDVERGPIERRYGLATLTLYTAGTHHSAVALTGLADAEAVELRDALIPAQAADAHDF